MTPAETSPQASQKPWCTVPSPGTATGHGVEVVLPARHVIRPGKPHHLPAGVHARPARTIGFAEIRLIRVRAVGDARPVERGDGRGYDEQGRLCHDGSSGK